MSEIADPTVQEEIKIKHKRPKRYHVVMLNDDYTPMDFVVTTLLKYFEKSEQEAVTIMLQIHQGGKGIAGTYSYEIADQKAKDTMDEATVFGYPLQCQVEEAPSDNEE